MGAPSIISQEQCSSGDISGIDELNNGHFQFLTSTPSQSQTKINDSHLMGESFSMPSTIQTHDMNLLPIGDARSCEGCKALEKRVTAMEMEMIKMKENHTRFDQTSKQNLNKSSNRQSDEILNDKRLLQVKAAAFVTERPLTAHMCKQLVLYLYDNEPPPSFTTDDIKAISDRRDCRDVQSLSKWAVFEMFSLEELIGRNCLGGGYDASTGNAETKKPFNECKMQAIKTAIFTLYPQQNEGLRKYVWMKCVDKINTDVRYLFKVSLKKHEWLQLGF